MARKTDDVTPAGTTAKKKAAKKAARKPTSKKAAKKAPAKKAPTKKAAAKKRPAKKVAKKVPAKKAPAKKTPAKKVSKKVPAKKTAAKKTAAKKTPAKKAAVSAADGLEGLVHRLIAGVAERGLSVVYSSVGDAALATIGFANFVPPPSYRRAMAAFGALRVLDSEGEIVGLSIFTPAEVAQVTRGRVRVPPGVRWEDAQGRPCTITTDHLIAFAEGPRGCVWCFDAAAVGPDGEMPVVSHDEDEPLRARDVATGAPVSSKPPDHPDFTAWLVGQVESVCAPPRPRD